jgi:hypothetical protein
MSTSINIGHLGIQFAKRMGYKVVGGITHLMPANGSG